MVALVVLGLNAGCGSSSPSSSGSATSCASLSGASWSPQVSGVTPSNHDATVTVSKTITDTSGFITGLAQAAPMSREVAVTIDMTQDLGPFGSLTLIGQVTSYPSPLQGHAFAYLVSLSDGTNEYINLARSGSAGDCSLAGYYSCSGSSCNANSSCSISWPSAYSSRTFWEQRQGLSNSARNLPSVNVFPTCNWTGGTAQSASDPACAFNSTFFPVANNPARLRYGVNYTARYLILADSYSSVTGYTAGLKVTAIKKSSPRTTQGGAFDINFVLVGDSNVKASRTSKGQRNLNSLATLVSNYFGQTTPNLKIGAVNAIEWPCQSGGEEYSIAALSELPKILAASSSLVPAANESKALNVFLVSSIEDDSSSANSNVTILGVDGAIPGPVINGTASSGMLVSTFDMLDKYNPLCSTGTSCSANQQEESFFQMGVTVAHEAGHYFGLNHLSERAGTSHDFIRDTPICTATVTIGGVQYLTISSCLNSDSNVFSGTNSTCSANCASYTSYDTGAGHFCPAALACEFNYMMWWTSKNYHSSTGASDGVLFSTQEGAIVNYHPLVQ